MQLRLQWSTDGGNRPNKRSRFNNIKMIDYNYKLRIY
jgi:hypothetical protein